MRTAHSISKNPGLIALRLLTTASVFDQAPPPACGETRRLILKTTCGPEFGGFYPGKLDPSRRATMPRLHAPHP